MFKNFNNLKKYIHFIKPVQELKKREAALKEVHIAGSRGNEENQLISVKSTLVDLSQ